MRFALWLLAPALFLVSCSKEESAISKAEEAPEVAPLDDATALAVSAKCIECHTDAHDSWKHSHHALAHRNMGTDVDAEAFAGQEVTEGDAHWKFSGGAENPTIRWEDKGDTDAEPIEGKPEMAIGVDPLVQYLLATPGGRYQVPDMAWDPHGKEWSSIYGDENRRPKEWGHWTQRGMNWNAQCAYCHFTGLRKNYDPEKDTYETKWVEQGINCTQCHGATLDQPGPDGCLTNTQQKFSKEQWTHSCGTCHARREEFDEKFITGRSFHDHYGFALPSRPGLWFPDGQQLDEVYKFNSLMMSRMGHKGIGCTDCHDPHAADPIGGDLAVRSNALCMTCHAGGANEAIVIDPAKHTFHEPGTPGSSCVDCHMPKRTYMGKDPRSDHRFPRPDPLLSKELGVPNACNDCHSDKGQEWQIEWTHKWYGENMNAVSRKRSRAIHAAYEGKTGSLDMLLSALQDEEIDTWRATMLRLMEPWLTDSRVEKAINRAAYEGDVLERAAAAMLLGRRGEMSAQLEKLLEDPVKSVRVEAGWSAIDYLPGDHPVIAELTDVARHQADQPAGAMRMARLAIKKRDAKEAEKWIKRAVNWDQTSAAPKLDLAVFLSGMGRTDESVVWLEQAMELDPNNAEIPYLTGLGYAELGDYTKAKAYLTKAVEIEPRFSRAWYNLSQIHKAEGNMEATIAALKQVELTDSQRPDAPFERAMLLLQSGNIDEAKAAFMETLRRDPNNQQAKQILMQLDR